LSPGRRTNRKNLRSCQRTILFYSFYFFRQSKICPCNYLIFQSSAARPQAHDRIWCKAPTHSWRNPRWARSFAFCIDVNRCESAVRFYFWVVNIAHSPCLARDFKSAGSTKRILSPLWAGSTPSVADPRLAPWAAFFRRFAAINPSLHPIRFTTANCQETSIGSSTRRLSFSSEPVSSNEFVMTALPLSTLVMT
jgi:hypothetical protein